MSHRQTRNVAFVSYLSNSPVRVKAFDLWQDKPMDQDLTWKASYSVGHTVLDEQHQQLLDLCKRAIDWTFGRHEHKNIHEILNDLVEFVRMHDTYEESVLKMCNFPLIEEHAKEHSQVMVKFLEFIHDLLTGELDKHVFADFLSDWLNDHVLKSDMKYQTAVLQIGPLI
jgi:hemerythrin